MRNSFGLLAPVMLVLTGGAISAELIPNGRFGAGAEPWWATQNLSFTLTGGALCVDVPGGLANPWDAIIGLENLSLTAGQAYNLSFFATGTPEGPIRALVQRPDGDNAAFLELNVTALPAGSAHGMRFDAPQTLTNAQFALQLGGSATPWTFCLDDVSLTDGAPTADESPAAATAVWVNQLGYLPTGPKRATIASDAAAPLAFSVLDASGAEVFAGQTEPRGMDISAGLPVHVADFTRLDLSGENFTLKVLDQVSPPFAIQPGLYADLSIDALSYFYPVRSGIEISGALAGPQYDRPAGHVGAPGTGSVNQGDRDVPCQPPEASAAVYGEPWTCDYTLSPVGGWYDAGDHGKYVVNGGISVAQLLAAYERAALLDGPALAALGDSTLKIPESGNGIPDILDEARWELDFIAAMTVPEGQPLAGMVHHKIHDNEWTGLPTLPHLDDKLRELHRPSTAATLNAAAVFAQASRLFARFDSDYATTLANRAVSAFAAAEANPAIFAPAADGDAGGGPYDDQNVDDEFFWAAAELAITTGDSSYMSRVTASSFWGDPSLFISTGFDWANVAPFAVLQLVANRDTLSPDDALVVTTLLTTHADYLLTLVRQNPFGHAYDPPEGRYGWGSNHLVLQNATILAAAHDLTGDVTYRDAAIESMDYVLGRNALSRSYITGYGTLFSENQHSRWFANQLDPSLPHPPKGSLAGGANADLMDPIAQKTFGDTGCAPQTCYIDHIESWGTNEITINWNAALAQLASYLADQ